MKGKRFKEEQIIRILHEAERGMAVVDEFTRQGFDIHVGRSITSHDVIRILGRLFQQHGRPVCLRSDNGPENSTYQKFMIVTL